jgi:hypothetical protein
MSSDAVKCPACGGDGARWRSHDGGSMLACRICLGTGEDQRPHGRACRREYHRHGHDCEHDCPTCGGRPLPDPEPDDFPRPFDE